MTETHRSVAANLSGGVHFALSAEVASAAGIESGDLVEIEQRDGELRIRAAESPDTDE